MWRGIASGRYIILLQFTTIVSGLFDIYITWYIVWGQRVQGNIPGLRNANKYINVFSII